MVQSKVGHIQINVDPKNIAFYKELLSFLGWKSIYEDENMLGIMDKEKLSLWFTPPLKTVDNDYDGKGMNHLALSVDSQSDVDKTVAFLQEHGVEALFETPRHRPEFSGGPENTYYQVMFESPDHILFEVVYTGTKEK